MTLRIHALHVAYGTKPALEDISMQVSPGEILALIGPNGAGKSTLIRAVSGLLNPKAGQIYFGGQELSRLTIAARARLMAVVPQVRHMGGAFSVHQTVMMGRTAHMSWLGKESAADHAAVQLALEQTDLVSFAARQIAQLSGGEQQRVLLARALAQETPVLLLDEPTNHLDLQHQTNLLALVKKLAREKNLAVLMALHDLNLVSFCADRVGLLVNGRLKSLGTPKEVLTAEHISPAYQTPIEIIAHPESGAPIIFPAGMLNKGK